jgi:predicted helicase
MQLAYRIDAINIESVYHNIAGEKHMLFDGICLIDAIGMYRNEHVLGSKALAENAVAACSRRN